MSEASDVKSPEQQQPQQQAHTAPEGPPEPPVFRLDSTAMPSLYELDFDVTPHMAFVLNSRTSDNSAATPTKAAVRDGDDAADDEAAPSTISNGSAAAPEDSAGEPPVTLDNTAVEHSTSSASSAESAPTELPPQYLRFAATARIHVIATANIGHVTLHSLNLDIDSITWYVEATEPDPKPVESWALVAENETLKIVLGETIAENRQIVLVVEYGGPIAGADDFTHGMFLADPTNDELSVATQLEPTNARRLFPCFDEPTFQAKFQMSVKYPVGYVCKGNTRMIGDDVGLDGRHSHDRDSDVGVQSTTSSYVRGRSPEMASAFDMAAQSPSAGGAAAAGGDSIGGAETPKMNPPLGSRTNSAQGSFNNIDNLSVDVKHSTPLQGPEAAAGAVPALTPGVVLPSLALARFQVSKFEPTPAISPYLVCFVVGRYHCVEASTKSKMLTRVYVPVAEPRETAWFALDLFKKAIEYFEDFFGYALPMTKMDIVALPRFDYLGMENWGLLTFVKDFCVVSEKSTLERRQRIARLVGHEVAHQWFGNTVSLQWWTFIWLKEGLARFLEFMFVQNQFPRWEIWTTFVSDIQSTAMRHYTGKGHLKGQQARAIEISTGLHPRDIPHFFDVTSYGKAASVVRMLHQLVGDGVLAASLRQFIHRHAGSTATSLDLIACFQDQLNKAVAAQALANPLPRSLSLEPFMTTWVRTPNHPYIYVTHQDRVGAADRGTIHAAQFLCPDLAIGFSDRLSLRVTSPPEPDVDIDPLQRDGHGSRKRSAARPASADLLPTAVLPRLEQQVFPVPLTVADVRAQHTVSSTKVMMTDAQVTVNCPPPAEDDEDSGAVGSRENGQATAVLVNAASSALCHTDYSVPMWHRIMAVINDRPAIERLTVGITLFELRTVLVGVTSPADTEDRCVFLLRYLYEMGERNEQHSTVWQFVSAQLPQFIMLIKDQPCWNEVRQLIIHVHRHYVSNKAVSFFEGGRDSVVDFKASYDTSTATRTMMLANVCACGQMELVAEAVVYFRWAVASWCSDAPAPKEVTMGDIGGASANGMPEQLLLPAPSNFWVECPDDLAEKPYVLDYDRAMIAFQTVMVNTTSVLDFWAVLNIATAAFHLFVPAEDLLAMPAETLAVRPAALVKPDDKWHNVLLVAIVACQLPEARNAQLAILRMYVSLSAEVELALIRNDSLLSAFFEVQPPSKLKTAVITRTLKTSANALVTQQLVESGAVKRDEAVVHNSAWADYVNDHYSWYIKYVLMPRLKMMSESWGDAQSFTPRIPAASSPDSARGRISV
jgi:hypothetical protein